MKNRPRVARVLCLAVFALAGGGGGTPPASGAQGKSASKPPTPPRPNVVIILSDDQGYHDVGFHGVKDIPTPHIDSLARNGVRCTNAYVTGSVCSPSRAGLLTGRYQQRFGHENLPRAFNPDDGLPLGEVTLASLLKGVGYQTAALGKWHLGVGPPFHPNRRGFDHFFGFLEAQHDYFNYGGRDPIQRNGTPVAGGEYLTDALTGEAVAFIKENRSRPFFLYLAYNAVHTPNQAPQSYLDRFPDIPAPLRKSYAAMLSAMDDGVGRVLDTLRGFGLEENTLVFYLSDHGGPLTILGPNGADNSPLRGQKTQLYEGGIRVPFVVQWKGVLPAGRTYDHPVIALDLFTTAAAAARARLPRDRVYDGVDLLPYLSGAGREAPHNLLFWRQGGGQQYAVRDHRYKLVFQGGQLQLFNLEDDIGETTDLAAQKPQQVNRLSRAYERLNRQMVRPLWGPGS